MAKNDHLRDLLNEIKLRYSLDEEQFAESIKTLSLNQQPDDYLESQQLEFNLQLKLLEAQKLSAFLEKISFKSEKERSQWLDGHQQLVIQLGELIIQDSNLSLNALRVAGEHSQLSLQLADEINKVINLMNTIFLINNQLSIN
ncbi:MAG: hypothetical protein GX559_02670 [Candidatus Pacebacteria bacterium]|nr:hypothetical protein [Candidatus Paceibacterota bacterium]